MGSFECVIRADVTRYHENRRNSGVSKGRARATVESQEIAGQIDQALGYGWPLAKVGSRSSGCVSKIDRLENRNEEGH